jgi:hypothetical protein
LLSIVREQPLPLCRLTSALSSEGMIVASAGPRNKNEKTNTMTIQVYFGADEWKAEDVNVSVLFGMSSP